MSWRLMQRTCHITKTTFLAPLACQKISSFVRLIDVSHHRNRRVKQGEDLFGVKCKGLLMKRNHRLLHTSVDMRQRLDVLSILKDARSNLAKVQMTEMKNAPLPVFWTGVGGLAPYVAPVFVQMFTGYMPVLGITQLVYSGTILSFLGGLKFGSMLHCEKNDCSWENIGLATVPAIWAWSALLLPTGFGFLTVGTGLIASLVIDLATSKYPPWFVALKCFLTITATLFVLLGLKQYLFNNRHFHENVIEGKV